MVLYCNSPRFIFLKQFKGLLKLSYCSLPTEHLLLDWYNWRCLEGTPL